MQVPKRKTSKSRRNTRRAHDALTTRSLADCPNCHSSVLPHRVCPNCGQYRGKQVVKTAE